MVTSIFLNIIYLAFPFLCYFIYMVYSKTSLEDEKKLFFDLTLFSSLYLYICFGNLTKWNIFLINIPIFIAIYKKKWFSCIILVIFISIYRYKIFDISYFLSLINYSLVVILSFLYSKKRKTIFIIINIIFSIYELLVNNFFSYGIILKVIFINLCLYILFFIIELCFDRLSTMIKMFYSFDEIMNQKVLYESLFKITHEIKNPLAVCKGYLDMMDVSNINKTNKYVGIINQEIDRTLLLLKDFSDVSKVVNIDKSDMDIVMLLEDVCDEVNLMFNDVNFIYNISGNEIYISGDYNRLKQVLLNLLKNAKESLNLKKGEIILWGKVKKNNYIITIKDNGVGISKEDLEKIGTAFYTTKKNGTGLGVCFSKEIIEKHGGTICYKSKENEGTLVSITLPIIKKDF